MSRSVSEWRGNTDDSPVPPRVRLRVWEKCLHACHVCERVILPGEKWTLEHRIALINGGANAETNLCLTCCNCLAAKNAADVVEKATVARTRKKHLGIKSAKRPMPGSRDSKWKRFMDGHWERRPDVE